MMSSASVPSPAAPGFSDLGLSEPLLKAIEASGYTAATPIQASAIPVLLAGRDVVGQAQTGTGKTAAFAVPLLQRIDVDRAVPQVLVLTPTRELAIQVAKAFDRYAVGLDGVRTVAIYGGQDYQVQFRGLDGGTHVVVGTPGRVMDHLRRGTLKLEGLKCLVLDEADEMLRMGFAEDVEWVLTQAPAGRQVALFSATMPETVRRIAQQHLTDPVEVTMEHRPAAATTVRQRVLVVPPAHKLTALGRVLEAEATEGVIVFVKTKTATERLADALMAQGVRVAALSSDVAQKQRERIVEQLRAGRIDVIVATDVAARGLDVPRISHVVNFDMPFDTEGYIHRIGRTGRAGRSGEAILFVTPKERPLIRRIERATNQPFEPMEVPSRRAINQRRLARFHERITAAAARPDLKTFTSVVEQYRAQYPDVPLEQVAAALAALAAGEAPLFLMEDDAAERRMFPSGEGAADRGDRPAEAGQDRPRPGKPSPRDRRTAGPMETYRIEVGLAHGVHPGKIVGAIANEAGLTSEHIGRIELFENYSHVDMLVGMPRETFQTLRHVKVSGQPLNISRAERVTPSRGEGRPDRPPRPSAGPRRFNRAAKAK